MKEFRVIIAGGRDFDDYDLLKKSLDHLLQNKKNIVIISGTANGADKLGEKYADEKDLKILRFPAKWDKFGKSAGYKRNVEMADNADALIAFWNGYSRGTKHMIDITKSKRLQVRVVKYKKEKEK